MNNKKKYSHELRKSDLYSLIYWLGREFGMLQFIKICVLNSGSLINL